MTYMDGHRRDVTVADVARQAGVSKATASRALGGYGQVSATNREKVLATAADLEYRPNELARSMNTGRSKTLGVLVGEIENNYFGMATRGITDVARSAGYDVILINTSEDVEAEADATRVLLDKRVDAVIVSPVSSYNTAHLKNIIESGRPLVMLDRHIKDLSASAVEVDIAPAAKEATNLLIDYGHKRISYISALKTDSAHFTGFPLGVSSVEARLRGIMSAMRRAGLELNPEHIRFKADSAEDTHVILGELLQAEEPPTALIVSDSTITVNVLRSLRQRGLSVPGDLSLITFDDLAWTEFIDPPLTVVAQPVYEVGRDAALTALRQIGVEGLALPHGSLRAHLIRRDSVSAPKT